MNTKTCFHCKTNKSILDFHKKSAKKDGLNPSCKQCVNTMWDVKQYRTQEENRIHVNAWAINNRQKVRNRMAQWVKENPAQHKINCDRWQKRNPANLLKRAAKRRAFKLQAIPKWVNYKKIQEFYETANGLNMLTGEWHDVDHIVPLQSKLVCGLHCEANLQVLPRKVNQSKGNRFWLDMP